MRVLLVEDQLQLAESVAQALKGTGLTVDVLHDGVAADLALSSEEYAVAILDVGLPRMDGFEVLAQRWMTGFRGWTWGPMIIWPSPSN